MKIFLYLVLFFSFISLCFCKKVTKTLSFSELEEENWRYMTKFGFERGHGKFQIRARLLQPLKNLKYPYEDFKILTSVFLDIEFPEALRRQKCDDKNLMSR